MYWFWVEVFPFLQTSSSKCRFGNVLRVWENSSTYGQSIRPMKADATNCRLPHCYLTVYLPSRVVFICLVNGSKIGFLPLLFSFNSNCLSSKATLKTKQKSQRRHLKPPNRRGCSPTAPGCSCPCRSGSVRGWSPGRGAARAGRCRGRGIPGGSETQSERRPGDPRRSSSCRRTYKTPGRVEKSHRISPHMVVKWQPTVLVEQKQ